MSKEVLILGGGFAGLAAGVALAGAGKQVRVLEQRPFLGGRARSFRDPVTGAVVDNGQHLIMGCYHETLRFLGEIGTLDRIRFQPRLELRFLDGGGRVTSLECPTLPSPWHLLVGVLRSSSFSWREKLEVLRLGRVVQGSDGITARGWQSSSDGAVLGPTVDQWLQDLGQSEPLRRNFWDLLSIAALNEDPRIASAALFARVLKLALFTSPADSRIGMAVGGLSECYTEGAVRFITSRGGRVETSRHAGTLMIPEGACRGVKLANGEAIETSAVISAVPWMDFLRLLPAEVRERKPFFARIAGLRSASIISINLWFDREITDLAFAGLRGTTVQWMFNKRNLSLAAEFPEPNPESPAYVSLVISGAHALIARSKEDLVNTALEELRRLLPEARQARLVRSLVIKERFATFSSTPAAEELRPPARTPVRGLYLAGDWTATGLPATIEGAVKSGHAASAEVLRADSSH